MMKHNRDMWDKLHREGYVGYSMNSNLSNATELLPKDYLNGETKALELGCGRGDYMKKLASSVGEVHGVDISREAVKLAWINMWWTPNAYPTVCNGHSLPYPDNYFDFIYEMAVFQHIPREYTRNYLKEAYRCLKHGAFMTAQFISRVSDDENHGDIELPNKEETIGYTLDDIRDIVADSGLSLINVETQLVDRDNVFWYKILCVKGDIDDV